MNPNNTFRRPHGSSKPLNRRKPNNIRFNKPRPTFQQPSSSYQPVNSPPNPQFTQDFPQTQNTQNYQNNNSSTNQKPQNQNIANQNIQPGPNDFGLNIQNLGAFGNNPLLQVGVQQAQQYVDNSFNKFSPGVGSFWNNLQFHFTVDNQYVLQKIKLLMFPFLHKFKEYTQKGANDARTPPNLDFEAVDLYIPLMSFVTYTLLVGLIEGKLSDGFSPDMLSSSASISSTLVGLQISIIQGVKFAFAVRNVDLTVLEFIGLSSYKFFGLSCTLVLGLCFGTYAFLGSFAYAALTGFVFNGKYLMNKIEPREDGSLPKRAKALILIYIVLELTLLTYLGYTPEFFQSQVSKSGE
eukprot:snap_masked-scaffold_11-processed-gene-11.18-mRNA-1 protein AED:1.00 eAED:1.00 QI:0/-1/0/0/-1/1/1/0/350